MGTHQVGLLLSEQSGVIARRQVLRAGLDDGYIRARIRRRQWVRVHAGVFVDHTGPLTWEQRAWAGVLYYWSAALSDESVLQIEGLRQSGAGDDAIHVAVDHSRRVAGLRGVTVHRVRDLVRVLRSGPRPPRMNLEHALLRVAARQRRSSDTIAIIGDACQRWHTTPERLRAALRRSPRLPRRGLLARVLDDAAEGYLGLHTVVELDGRLGHELANDRWDDMDRDIASATSGDLTVRVGWKQVEDSCRTAIAVGHILSARGWSGLVRACSDNCPVGRVRGDLPSHSDDESPRTRSG